jgi:hypothetical protein
MGIQNRDYMKQPADDDGRGRSMPEVAGWHAATMEEKLEEFLQRHPHFFTWLTIGLVVLVVGVLVAVNLWSGRR